MKKYFKIYKYYNTLKFNKITEYNILSNEKTKKCLYIK